MGTPSGKVSGFLSTLSKVASRRAPLHSAQRAWISGQRVRVPDGQASAGYWPGGCKVQSSTRVLQAQVVRQLGGL